MNKRILIAILLFVIAGGTANLFAQKRTKVEILNSRYFRYNKNLANGARRLIGNVKFRQDSTIMECDSAWFYSEQNMFEAFGHVHLYKEGDETIDVRSDFLRHDGNKKLAQFRYNVVLRDTQIVLKTDSLDYDIRKDIGYYLYGAEIIDSATTLTSIKGYYHHYLNEVFFKDSVVVVHNGGEYEMYTDTLKYNTISEITYFLGPTEFYNDSNYMYAEFGWYNTVNNKALFRKNAFFTNPGRSIVADSFYIDRNNNYGIAHSNVVATDSAEDVQIYSNYLKMTKEPEVVVVTDSALLVYIVDFDTLFIHADTLMTMHDSTGEYRLFKAFHHVRMFKSNFQSQSDSLFFSTVDSVLQFHGSPVLWAEDNQITAGYIEAFVVNNVLDKFKLYDGGVIVSMEDTSYFNQVKGVEMTGYLKDSRLYKIDVHKKSETIYFPVDESGIIGANRSTSDNMTIYLKNNKIRRIVYREGYNGKMLPLEKTTPKKMRVKGFQWLENERPLIPEDVFLWKENSGVRQDNFNEILQNVGGVEGKAGVRQNLSPE